MDRPSPLIVNCPHCRAMVDARVEAQHDEYVPPEDGLPERVSLVVCPTCHHRDIDPCPNCAEEVPRQEYEKIAGDLFRCPRCRRHVRLRINPDAWLSDGTLNEPVVVTEDAQV